MRALCFSGTSYVHFSKKCQNHNSVGGRAHEVEEILGFCLILTLIFPILEDHEKGKSNVFKDIRPSSFRELQ